MNEGWREEESKPLHHFRIDTVESVDPLHPASVDNNNEPEYL
jgi:hypothetical protein